MSDGGVWRTINGARVFIRDGNDLKSAIAEKLEAQSKRKNGVDFRPDGGIMGMSDGDAVNLPDIVIGRSVGAQARNYDIEMPDGELLRLSEGSRVTDVEVIAGKGRDRQIDIVDVLVEKYGGNPDEWQKVKGLGCLDVDGESYKAELHWYQEPTIGRVMWKLKPQVGGGYFIDED